jgi:hypothetical protein
MPLFQTDAPESKQSNEEKDFSQPHKPENITASKPHVPHSRPGSTEAIAPSTVSSSEKKAVNRRNHSRQNSGEKPSVAAHQLNLFGSTPALEAEKPETTESKNAEVSTIDEQDIQTPTTNEQNHNNEDES